MSTPLGQLILTGVPGNELDAETAALFRRVQPGGFILFGRNIQSASQLRKLIDDLRDLSEVEPIITIDQEGGRVSRLRLIGNEPPNAQQLRDKGDVALDPAPWRHHRALAAAFRFQSRSLSGARHFVRRRRGQFTARPLLRQERSSRSSATAGAFNDAHAQARGSRAAANIFPATRPRRSMRTTSCRRSSARARSWTRTNWPSFAQFVDTVDSMMICHGWYPCFDAEKRPASLSPRVVTELLRDDSASRADHDGRPRHGRDPE